MTHCVCVLLCVWSVVCVLQLELLKIAEVLFVEIEGDKKDKEGEEEAKEEDKAA